MHLAWLSFSALAIAVVVSCVSELNVGVLSIVLAWIVGVYFGGLRIDELIRGFPTQLFLTLVGVTMLFAQAQINGTLDKIAHGAVTLCRGNTALIPVMFFVLACAIASLGPGNIATAAMFAPMAMATAYRAGISPFLMAIMVGMGAQAGSLSPVAPTGIIVNNLMTKIGLPGHELWTYTTNLAAHAAIASGGYLLLGGWRLFGRTYEAEPAAAEETRFDSRNWITIAGIVGVMLVVLVGKANIGMAAFGGAALLAILRVADHEQAVRKVPWSTVLMVTGVTVLIALLEKTGGLDLFTAFLARFSTANTLTGFVAFVTGAISVYSSTSGVVLPAFLPTIPGLVASLGADPLSVAASMNIGAHLVDMSPLSTTGAVCLAAIVTQEDVRPTYNKLLAWGMSMTVVGAIGCYLFL